MWRTYNKCSHKPKNMQIKSSFYSFCHTIVNMTHTLTSWHDLWAPLHVCVCVCVCVWLDIMLFFRHSSVLKATLSFNIEPVAWRTLTQPAAGFGYQVVQRPSEWVNARCCGTWVDTRLRNVWFVYLSCFFCHMFVWLYFLSLLVSAPLHQYSQRGRGKIYKCSTESCSELSIPSKKRLLHKLLQSLKQEYYSSCSPLSSFFPYFETQLSNNDLLRRIYIFINPQGEISSLHLTHP